MLVLWQAASAQVHHGMGQGLALLHRMWGANHGNGGRMSEYILNVPDYVPPFDPAVRVASLGEEVVRCRDCVNCREHNMRAYGGRCDQLLCHHFSMSSGAGWPVEPDGFCAWGERRDA